jgi:anti-sigma factor ChrR (cupin superfamily)
MTGEYQVEIEGITQTEYAMDAAIDATCIRTADRQGALPSSKVPRAQPSVSTASAPAGVLALPDQPAPGVRVYLPTITR